jgi:polysaccharide pyruvyl transferase WcaK-like protein
MKTIRIILTNAPIYNGNKGCVALTYSALYILNEIASNKKIDIRFFLPESGSVKNGKDSIQINNSSIHFENIYSLHFSLKMIMKFIIRPKIFIQTLKIYFSADFILDIGLGDSFADIYGDKRFNEIIKEYKIAKFLRKKIGVLPQTIGPFKSEKNIKKAKKYVEYADFVFARDKQSSAFLQANTSQKNIFELIDIAFYMPFSRKEFSKNNIHVGINISGLLWHGGYTQKNQFGFSKEMYQNVIYAIINHFLKIENVKIHIIAHVMSEKHHIENDYIVGKSIVEEFNNERIVLAPFFFTPIEAKNYISGLDFFTGARMHACIAAFSSGVPVFPLAYSRKFNGLFGDTLLYNNFGDLVIESEFEIMEKLSDSFSNKEFLFESIRTSLDTIIEERYQLLQEQLKIFLNV